MGYNQPFLKPGFKQCAIYSSILAGLMGILSLVSLLFPAAIYASDAHRHTFLSNDVVNLFIGLPILVGSMLLAQQGKLIGLLFWPGALLYITYNYIAYAVAMPFTWPFIIFLALVVLSACTVFLVFRAMDLAAIRQQLEGNAPARFAGGMLVVMGLLFCSLAASEIAGALSSQGKLPMPEMAVQIADLTLAPFWIIGGVLLWRRHPLGYASAAGLLFQTTMLFIALLAFFIFQPVVTGAPFPVDDFVTVAVMGLLSYVPFGLYLRGALRKAPGF